MKNTIPLRVNEGKEKKQAGTAQRGQYCPFRVFIKNESVFV